MTTTDCADLGAEREIDLAAAGGERSSALWWIAVAGLVIGAIVGGLYSLRGGSNFKATALIARGQRVRPSGDAGARATSRVHAAVSQIVSRCDLSGAGRERGRHAAVGSCAAMSSVAQVGSAGAGGDTTRRTLISLDRHRSAAEERGRGCRERRWRGSSMQQTTASYVNSRARDLPGDAGQREDAARGDHRAAEGGQCRACRGKKLDPLEQLVIVAQQNNAETPPGRTSIAQTTTLQQQIVFAQEVEQTQIVQTATAEKTTAALAPNSILVGALIGLLIGRRRARVERATAAAAAGRVDRR